MNFVDKKVIVVIVTYNGAQWLEKCFHSLEQSHYENDVIVIDNNSTDNSIEIIQSFPKIKLIQSAENLGFGKANNIGIQKALESGADYVFLLNQDTWVFPDTISNLVEVAESNDAYGILSPLHYSGDEIHLDANFEKYWNRKINTISEQVDEVPFVNAAAWLLPINVIKKAGYFESMFQHYGEDRNYNDRVLFHKFKTVVVKTSKICHDRIITRNFKKDYIQSKYSIQAEVLNINNSLFVSYLRGFRLVFGLPKYFFTLYSLPKSILLFIKLLFFYIRLKIKFIKVIKKRFSYK